MILESKKSLCDAVSMAVNDYIETKDITWNADGEGFISQVKLSSILSMTRSVFQKHLKVLKIKAAINLNKNNQIHEDSLFDVVEYMAYLPRSKQETKDFFYKIKKLGSRALLVGLDGKEALQSNQQVTPLSTNEIIHQIAGSLVKHDKELAATNLRIDKLEQAMHKSIAVSGTSEARNNGYYSIMDCRSLMGNTIGITALKRIIEADSVKYRAVGKHVFYNCTDMQAAVSDALILSDKISKVTYRHPDGFTFIYRK